MVIVFLFLFTKCIGFNSLNQNLRPLIGKRYFLHPVCYRHIENLFRETNAPIETASLWNPNRSPIRSNVTTIVPNNGTHFHSSNRFPKRFDQFEFPYFGINGNGPVSSTNTNRE